MREQVGELSVRRPLGDLLQPVFIVTELGDLMPSTGGFRKMRWADMRRGKVAEVGCELSHHFKSDHQICLMTVFDKDEASDLNPKDKKSLKSAIEGKLAARVATRGRPRKSRRIC